ncbi:carboxypeptidase regulatory-like domain-containing protein [Maribacter antarcticus]|uniref:carboxypeptidase regulatory-like domain-containing protein n=1 Tax=Maribacter antarcticus TaxID=505250 RepID=UPI00047DF666|nr:carboxypeptidase regulatory-like domain-containing protein [Maribacter antarcticus]
MANFENTSCLMAFVVLFTFCACEEETLGDQSFGVLDGKVVSNGLNNPLGNVKVTTNPSSNTVFTDEEGNFTITNISIGDYSVQAEKDDFQTAFEPVNILNDKTSNVIFELDSMSVSNMRPLIPSLLFPEDNKRNVRSPVVFVWSSSANDVDEILYDLELRNGNTGEIQVFQSLLDTVFRVENLAIGANYFWQVSANDEITEPVQSKISSFQLQGVEGNRFLYVRSIDGNSVVFSGGEPTRANEVNVNENEVQLTATGINTYRPKANIATGKVAYIRSIGGESHIFTMNLDGTAKRQLTQEIPIAGFRQDELEFSWYDSGSAIYYPNFNKLYTVNADGSGTRMVYEALDGEFITEVATNPVDNQIVLKINDSQGYRTQLRIVSPETNLGTQTIISGITGAFGGLDYSLDGNRILYTRDISGTENAQYRLLDSRIFEYNLTTNTSNEIDTQKPTGFNNLDAKYSPNGGFIIFTVTSNDGISEKQIFRRQLDAVEVIQNELVFTNAFMPNWE